MLLSHESRINSIFKYVTDVGLIEIYARRYTFLSFCGAIFVSRIIKKPSSGHQVWSYFT